MADSHTREFLEFRKLILALEDEERRRLLGLFGSMSDPLPEASAGVLAAVRAFVQLGPADRHRVVRWFGAYVSRWGQVPVAASRGVATPQAGSTSASARSGNEAASAPRPGPSR